MDNGIYKLLLIDKNYRIVDYDYDEGGEPSIEKSVDGNFDITDVELNKIYDSLQLKLDIKLYVHVAFEKSIRDYFRYLLLPYEIGTILRRLSMLNYFKYCVSKRYAVSNIDRCRADLTAEGVLDIGFIQGSYFVRKHLSL